MYKFDGEVKTIFNKGNTMKIIETIITYTAKPCTVKI